MPPDKKPSRRLHNCAKSGGGIYAGFRFASERDNLERISDEVWCKRSRGAILKNMKASRYQRKGNAGNRDDGTAGEESFAVDDECRGMICGIGLTGKGE